MHILNTHELLILKKTKHECQNYFDKRTHKVENNYLSSFIRFLNPTLADLWMKANSMIVIIAFHSTKSILNLFGNTFY